MEKAVGYARYSTQKQDGGVTIESQDREMKRLALVKGWEYLRTYVDEAVSGAVDPSERPGLTELLDDAASSSFSIVICLDASRLARDQQIFWNVIGRFRELEVTLVTCVMPDITSDNPEFEIVAGSVQGMASYERKLVSIKTRLAHEILKQKGKAHGRPMFGFKINGEGYFEPDPLGSQVLEMLRMNPKIQAKNVSEQLGLEYYDGWTLLKNAKHFESSTSTT